MGPIENADTNYHSTWIFLLPLHKPPTQPRVLWTLFPTEEYGEIPGVSHINPPGSFHACLPSSTYYVKALLFFLARTRFLGDNNGGNSCSPTISAHPTNTHNLERHHLLSPIALYENLQACRSRLPYPIHASKACHRVVF